jgi:predicted RNA-binding Zn ribbon-like protein
VIQSGAINAVPALTLALANSGLPRKPSGSRQKLVSDPFCSTANLRKFLVPFVLKHDLQIDQKSLVSLKTWRDALVDALARPAGTEVSALTLATLNGLAEHVNRVRIFTPGFHVAEKLVCANIAERVAAACLNELALSEASRIKRCMRRECGLFFYDTTRNRSGRWHAEDPCGWRSRDERRRGKSAN